MKTRSILALAAGMALSGSAFGAQLFFTTTSTLTSATAVTAASDALNPTGGPTLTLTAANPTGSLFLWAKLAPPDRHEDDTDPVNPVISYTPHEVINGMGINVAQSSTTGGVVTGGNFAVNGTFTGGTSARWDTPASSTAAPNTSGANPEFSGAGSTIDTFRRVGVQKTGLTDLIAAAITDDNAGTPVDATPGSVLGTDGNIYVRFATVPVTGVAGGTVALNIVTNSTVFAMTAGDATSVKFGSNDAPVNGGKIGGGTTSTLPDAFVVVAVPEPASLSLLSLGALGLVARRRKA